MQRTNIIERFVGVDGDMDAGNESEATVPTVSVMTMVEHGTQRRVADTIEWGQSTAAVSSDTEIPR